MPFDTRIPLMAGQGVQAIDVDPQKAVTALYQAEAARALAQNRQAQAQMRMQQAAEEAALNAAMQSTGGNPMEAAKILTSGGHASAAQKVMEDHDKRVKGFYETSKAQMEVAGLESKWLADVARTMRGGPAGYAWGYSLLGRAKPDILKQAQLPDPDQYDGRPLPVLQEWEQFGVSAQERAKAAIDAMGAIQKTPDSLAAAWRALATAEDEDDVQGIRTMLMMHPEAESILQVLPSHFDPRLPEIAKQKIAQLEKQDASRANVQPGTAGDYVTRYLPPGAGQDQYDATLRRFHSLNDQVKPGEDTPQFVLETAPDPAERNTIIPGGTLTKGALWDQSENYLLTGENKYSPRSADPKQRANFTAILDTASARVQNDASIPQLRAEYAALNGAQKAQMKSYLNTSAFVKSAMMGIDQAETIAKKYDPSSVPIVNDIKIWWGRNVSGDPTLSELEVFVYNTARDYAKATSGSSGSVAQMTDAQIKASELLFSLRQSPEAFMAAIQSMRTDMANILKSQREALNEARDGILTLLDSTFGKPYLPPGAEAETAAKRSGRPTPGAPAWTAKAPDGRVITFPSQAARDAAVKDSAGQLTVEGGTTTTLQPSAAFGANPYAPKKKK